MLNDMDMITHTFPGDVHVIPVADVHLGAVEHASKAWEAFLQRIMDSPNTYIILAGDLLNNSVRGTRFANPFDEAMRPREAKKRMIEYLEPIKDRILCCVTGNHERRSLRDDDIDLTYDICCKLNIEHLYRENLAIMRLCLGKRSGENKPMATYIFAVSHGSGGGYLTGGSVNRDERMAGYIDGLDCFVAAHIHKGFITKPAKLVVDPRNGNVSTKYTTVISCVSWLNYGGYAARSFLQPALVAEPQMLTLKGVDHHNKRIITTW